MKPFYLSRLVIPVILLLGILCNANAQTVFSIPGGPYTYTVGPGVTQIGIDAIGGRGGDASSSAPYGVGGKGGRVQCNLSVTGGQVLYIYVGGKGATGSTSCCTITTTGGTGGGGDAMYYIAGPGGGASDIRTGGGGYTTNLATRLVVAGGGGGAGYGYCCTSNYNNGGDGGGLVGATGWMGNSQSYNGTYFYTGGGGTQSSGGQGGTYNYGCGTMNNSGSLGIGGHGPNCVYGGGGGGGYYGGGGAVEGGGGGGSSFADAVKATGVIHSPGYNNTGDGMVTIYGPTASAAPSSLTFGPQLINTRSVPAQYITLNGTYMGVGPLTITSSSTNFLISRDGLSWHGGSGDTISLSYIGATISNVNFYVKFAPGSTTGAYTGSISVTGGGLVSPINIPVSGSGANPCTGSGSLFAGLTNANPSSGNEYTTFAMSLTGTSTIGGLNYQWASAPTAGGPWTPIGGAITPSYTFTGITATTYYQASVNCPAGGSTVTSIPAAITYQSTAASGCTPTASQPNNGNHFILGTSGSNLLITGDAGSSINDPYNPEGSGNQNNHYVDNTATMNVNMSIGGSYGGTATGNPPINIGAGPVSLTAVQIWIDFNNDGNFTSDEIVLDTNWNGSLGVPVVHPLLTIPNTAKPGKYRMRAIACNGSLSSPGNVTFPYAGASTMIPCPTTAQQTADARDYSVTITFPPCSGTPKPGIADISQTTGCAPYTTAVYNIAPQSGPGINYRWYVSTDGTNYNPIGGATFAAYTPSITAYNSTVYYKMQVSCSNSGLSAFTNPVSATLNTPPTPITQSGLITGTAFNLCTFGNPATLVSSTGGPAAWSSGNTTVATIGSSSGIVSGLAVGYSNITYTNTATGCFSTQQVTVNALPGPITGSLVVCQNSSTTLTNSMSGGQWSFVPSTFGTINPVTGVLTAKVITGTSPTIGTPTYVNTVTACAVSAIVTMNPLPLQFVTGGSGSYCQGSTSTLHVTLAGSQTGVTYQLILGGAVLANVSGTGSPLDFGVQSTPGVYTVFATYDASGCGQAMIGSATIALNPLPLLQTVRGGGDFCVGLTSPPINVTGSQINAKYYLMLGSSVVDSLLGNGGSLAFSGVTNGGIYSVNAVIPGTGCSTMMTGSVAVIPDPLPTQFNVGGGGNYCLGSSGRPVTLDLTQTGVRYQLMIGLSPVGLPIPGTGGSISFGNQLVDGLYTVIATNISTGCTNTMNGSAIIAGKGLPDVEIVGVDNGGHFCAGASAGPCITVGAPTQFGVNYQLFLGTTPIGTPVAGTSVQICVGRPTVPGTYTVVATDGTTGCTSSMTGTAVIIPDAVPTAWTLSGGGNFCNGASGRHITLNGSNTGVSYFVIQGSTGDTITSMAGTGASLDFGGFTSTDVYTAIAANTLSGCSKNMTGVVSVGLNPLPAAFDVTGTGNYCSGTSGQVVGLDPSASGVRYQLYRGTTAVGSPVTGTGAPVSFGPQTTTGTYTVVGTNISTGCVNTMAGNAVVGINPLPVLHLVTGGGSYCAGDAGVNVGMNGSDLGIDYQLYLGITPVGGTLSGSGLAVAFGMQASAGNYTVKATDATTGCTRFMAGNANVAVNVAPTAYSVTGGGVFCAGGAGVHVGLSGSSVGVRYQLYNNGSTLGAPVVGSGSTVDFGAQSAQGTYTVVGTNAANGCTNTMTGNTVIANQPLPTSYNVTGGGSYCAGGSGVDVMLSNSDPGIDYTLYRGSTIASSAVGGFGSSIDFGPQLTPGNYTVKGVDATTGCIRTMASTASISINPLPNAYNVIGGGSYCAGGTGVHVFLSTSNPGVSYQLYNGGATVGGTVSGTGATLDFGLNTATGSYTVSAENSTTGCGNNMTGTATVAINALPADVTVTGGGGYCAGGSGVNVGLGSSENGVRYQLYNGTVAVGLPVNGIGTALSFGAQTAAGHYTVYAVNNTTTCAGNMTTSADVSINPLPAQYAVSGGGNYCATGIGVHVGLTNSDAGISYQLYYGGTATGIAVPGNGGPLDLGLQTAGGVYTVTASDGATSCSDAMSGSTVVNVIPVVLPSVNIASSIAGVVCADQLVHFTATPVNGGSAPTYQWSVNGITTAVGSAYNYIPVDGDVLVARIHSNAQCAIPDTGSGRMVMTVSPLEMPSAAVSVNPGATVCTGATAFFTATTMFGGTSPALTWLKNGVAVGTGTSYSYVPVNGDVITFELGSNFNCRLADNVFSAPVALTVQNPVLPTVEVTANPGPVVAPGQSVTFTATPTHAGADPMYQWVINSVPVHGATNATFTTSNLNNGDSVSCAVTGICDMVGFNSVKMSVRTTGIQQVSANGSDVKLLPNPNKGVFTLKGSLASATDEEAVIEVTDMIGQVVYTTKAMTHSGNIDEHISLGSSLANGMYILNLRSGSDNIVFHFVVEK